MTLKNFIIGMTLIAVISDAIIMPFYPQFFEQAFGMDDPRHVGLYIAATCLTVMFAFPLWAWVAKRVTELKILVYTQFCAGVLCLYCYQAESLIWFWVVSLGMIVCKGSYLLMYPYVMRLAPKDEHTQTIGLLSVIVHFGSILGAVIGGTMIEGFDANTMFLIMAIGDFFQMAVSAYLLNKQKFKAQLKVQQPLEKEAKVSNGFIVKLGLITLVFYFSAFLIRPFFSVYWESISAYKSTIVSGTVYAIPGIIALIALRLDKYLKKPYTTYHGIISPMLLGLVGLMLQGSQLDLVVVLGRLVYGWAVYHAVVRYDVLLFELSTPQSYATDYSKIHFFQNLGVLLSSFSSGILVDAYGLYIPFYAAFTGFVITLIMFYFCFRTQLSITKRALT